MPRITGTAVASESLSSLERSIATNEASLKIGAETSAKLQAQGEQLRQAVGNLEKIDATVSRALKTTNRMTGFSVGGCFEAIKDVFVSQPKLKEITKLMPPTHTPSPPKAGASAPLSPEDEAEARLDKALDVLSLQLKRLKAMAEDIGKELDEHNGILNVATASVDTIDDRIAKTTKKIDDVD